MITGQDFNSRPPPCPECGARCSTFKNLLNHIESVAYSSSNEYEKMILDHSRLYLQTLHLYDLLKVEST